MMENKIREALDLVTAEATLKENTARAVTAALRRRSRLAYPMRYATAVAACLILLLSISGYKLYTTPVATISVDVNPSLELSINRFDRVIAARAFNKDAQAILSTADVKNKCYSDALELLLCSDGFTPYLDENADISITVASKSDEHSTEILQRISSCDSVVKLNASCRSGHHENQTAAHEVNLSLGKYEAYLILHELDESISPEDVQGLTMWEIREWIVELGGEVPGSNGSDHGGDHGSDHSNVSDHTSEHSGNSSGTDHKENNRHGSGHHGNKKH